MVLGQAQGIYHIDKENGANFAIQTIGRRLNQSRTLRRLSRPIHASTLHSNPGPQGDMRALIKCHNALTPAIDEEPLPFTAPAFGLANEC